MTDRKQKIEELLTDLRSLRRSTAFGSAGSAKGPRITPAQWGVIMHIEQDGKSTVKNISRTLKITSSAATQLVDGLVRSGYLARNTSPEDRRIVALTLSKKSKNRIEANEKAGAAEVPHILCGSERQGIRPVSRTQQKTRPIGGDRAMIIRRIMQ